MENSDLSSEVEEMLSNLPKKKNLLNGRSLCFYQGFWISERIFKSVVSLQRNFVARDSDIIITSCPKSGTTWLKALSFSIVNRTRFALTNSPLLTANPHDLVPLMEYVIYYKFHTPDFENTPEPRILCTHIPYELLPISIKSSNCKIVYICRNPMDQFVSSWHFFPKLYSETEMNELPSLEECFDMFCQGIHSFGPFWSHVLGFYKAGLEKPDKVLVLKYEDLKADIVFNVKHLASFLGFPFSAEEEKQGIAEDIAEFCSFEKLKNLKTNEEGIRSSGMPNKAFFRKGSVGDWKNHLTPSMAERLESLIQLKFGDQPNLTFNSK